MVNKKTPANTHFENGCLH